MAETVEPPTIEINDALFCQDHFKEVCTECGYDGREENDTFYGVRSTLWIDCLWRLTSFTVRPHRSCRHRGSQCLAEQGWRLSMQEAWLRWLQSVLRMEETDQQTQGGCQEGRKEMSTKYLHVLCNQRNRSMYYVIAFCFLRMLTIHYALVSQGNIILAEHPLNQKSSFLGIIKPILSTPKPNRRNRITQPFKDYLAHYIVKDGFTYLVISATSADESISFAILADLEDKFSESIPSSKLGTHGLQESFGPAIQDLVHTYNISPPPDKIQKVKDETRRFITTILENRPREQDIPEMTERLQHQSKAFLLDHERRRWRSNLKILVFSGILGLAVLGASVLYRSV